VRWAAPTLTSSALSSNNSVCRPSPYLTEASRYALRVAPASFGLCSSLCIYPTPLLCRLCPSCGSGAHPLLMYPCPVSNISNYLTSRTNPPAPAAPTRPAKRRPSRAQPRLRGRSSPVASSRQYHQSHRNHPSRDLGSFAGFGCHNDQNRRTIGHSALRAGCLPSNRAPWRAPGASRSPQVIQRAIAAPATTRDPHGGELRVVAPSAWGCAIYVTSLVCPSLLAWSVSGWFGVASACRLTCGLT
jgi:hypothetical protein